MASPKERRIPAPVVLAAASAMLCIGGVAAYLSLRPAERPDGAATASEIDVEVHVDSDTPEGVAESFLDAWRKRAHDVALDLSSGPARRAVLARREQDRRLDEHALELKSQVWDRMASTRLSFRVRESAELEGGRLALRGTAEGEFVGQPYRRHIGFVLRQTEDRWTVETMELGEILTEVPEFLRLDRTGEGGEPAPEPEDGP